MENCPPRKEKREREGEREGGGRRKKGRRGKGPTIMMLFE